MELHRTRLFLLLAMFAVGVILYGEWQKEHPPAQPTSQMASSQSQATAVPDVISDTGGINRSAVDPVSTATSNQSEWIDITTDLLNLKIDPLGGDIVYAELLDYPQSLHSKEGEVLIKKGEVNRFIAQTGLVGKNDQGPDSKQKGRAKYKTAQSRYELGNNNALNVDLVWENGDGVAITKRYQFKRNSYVVDVSFDIKNENPSPWQGNLYGLLKQELVEKKSSGMFGLQTYQGGAVHTVDKPYKKLSFSDMRKKPFRQQLEGGWAALVEHYFLCAYIPNKDSKSDYYTRVDEGDIYNIIVTTPVAVAPHSTEIVTGQFYIGPEKADLLKEVAPGLQLTIDYGILWPISMVLFGLLKWIHSFVGNWGWSIILVTVIIKILFYKLSASSYRSMGQMRQLQPRIDALKAKYGDDKQGFSVAMMDLYRKDKINPLGGCLPILIQIPVFIALYYVLLESIELRQAPFMFWIQDLSAKDPFYVLPLIMGATMFLQQKMNPAPPDPIQAKIMMFMPLVFTVLFLSFPSGLVLYWTVNNLLSILQQWHITRSLGQTHVPATAPALKKIK
jgi:YidC/Oxa1 family membrane protein insertase